MTLSKCKIVLYSHFNRNWFIVFLPLMITICSIILASLVVFSIDLSAYSAYADILIIRKHPRTLFVLSMISLSVLATCTITCLLWNNTIDIPPFWRLIPLYLIVIIPCVLRDVTHLLIVWYFCMILAVYIVEETFDIFILQHTILVLVAHTVCCVSGFFCLSEYEIFSFKVILVLWTIFLHGAALRLDKVFFLGWTWIFIPCWINASILLYKYLHFFTSGKLRK